MFHWVITRFYQDEHCFIEFYEVILGFYWVLLRVTGFYLMITIFARFSWVLPVFINFFGGYSGYRSMISKRDEHYRVGTYWVYCCCC